MTKLPQPLNTQETYLFCINERLDLVIQLLEQLVPKKTITTSEVIPTIEEKHVVQKVTPPRKKVK